jgi:hypothetical protein
VLPSPTAPRWLSPQHHSVSSVRIPQVCTPDAPTCFHVLVPTWVGIERVDAEPLPSAPKMPSPQHHSVSSLRTPQEWTAPALTVLN